MLVEKIGNSYDITAQYGYVLVDKTGRPFGTKITVGTEEKANSFSEIKKEDVYQPKDTIEDLQRQIDELKNIIKNLNKEGE